MSHLQAEGPRKAQIGKMIISSTPTREAVMSVLTHLEPLSQVSGDSLQ